MILLTRLNGPVFALNPDLVERADCTPDTVITLVDGTKYVVDQPFDELLRTISDHRAMTVVARQQLYGGVAQIAERRPSMRIERRARSRDGDAAWAPPTPADTGDDED